MGKLSYNDNVHADALAGPPVPLPGLRRTAEPVRSTRLQTFLTVLNFHPFQGITGVSFPFTKYNIVLVVG